MLHLLAAEEKKRLTLELFFKPQIEDFPSSYYSKFDAVPELSYGIRLRLDSEDQVKIYDGVKIVRFEDVNDQAEKTYADSYRLGISYTLGEKQAKQPIFPMAFESSKSLTYVTWSSNLNSYTASLAKSRKTIGKNLLWLDLTYARLKRVHYPVVQKLPRLEYLALPLHGVYFGDPALKLPKGIKELVIYNSEIDPSGLSKLQDLKNLERLVFHGCWYSQHAVLLLEVQIQLALNRTFLRCAL